MSTASSFRQRTVQQLLDVNAKQLRCYLAFLDLSGFSGGFRGKSAPSPRRFFDVYFEVIKDDGFDIPV
jgi:hypothetical protein